MFLPLVVAAFLSLLFFYYRWVAKYPKGPLPLPLIGNMHTVDFGKHETNFGAMAEKWGGIYTVFIPIPFVVLTSYEAIKEAFGTRGEDFVDRPMSTMDEDVMGTMMYCPNGGVINSSGDSWREQRRTTLSIFRDFGMGKSGMEQKVQDSIVEFMNFIEKESDKDRVDLRWSIQVMVGNVINEVLFGFRYKYDDCAPLMRYVEDLTKFMEDISNAPLFILAGVIPWITKIPILGWHSVGKHKENNQRLCTFIKKQVDRALDGYSTNDDPECFVHAYAQKIPSNGFLNPDQLAAVAADFFLAGQETTTVSLRWYTLILAANQRVQDKLRAEIHSVAGKDRLPCMADRPKMPYAQACISELLRFSNILTVAVPHMATVDTEIQGHKISKGTVVVADFFYLLSKDPIYENPKEFRPERFLLEDGKTMNREVLEHTIPFSIGKRACAGESLARMELFLGVCALVQKYRLLPSPGQSIDLGRSPGSIFHPKRQTLKIEAV